MNDALYSLLAPEIFVGVLALVVLAVDLFAPRIGREHLALGAAAVLVAVLAWSFRAEVAFLDRWVGGVRTAFNGMIRRDSFAFFCERLFLLGAVGTLLVGRERLDRMGDAAGEYIALVLLACTGMMLLAASNDFLMLFVSVELVTVSFYAMVSFARFDNRSLEAGMKYLVLGALSSGVIVYGITFVYGATGSTRFDDVYAWLQTTPDPPRTFLFGMLMVLIAAGFKIAAVPFHVWAPDVYEGSPTPTAAYLATASKAAGFALLLRVVCGAFWPAWQEWTRLLGILAGITILYGNLGAIAQGNIKRMLGYSSIGHGGYLLLGVATLRPGAAGLEAAASIGYYLIAYIATSLAAFLVIAVVVRRTESHRIADYAGLAQRSPFLAAVMFVALLSLAGVPPLGGFFGKFLVLSAAVKAEMYVLALIGAVNVVVGLYYYLNVVREMYLHDNTGPGGSGDMSPIEVRPLVRITLLLLTIWILALGIYQQPFLDAARTAAAGLVPH